MLHLSEILKLNCFLTFVGLIVILYHNDLSVRGDCTLKGSVGKILMDHSKAMERGRRIDLFLESPFGILYDPITRKPLLLEGDPSLVHTMMLHEVRSLEMMVAGRFRFSVGGFRWSMGHRNFV